jgi:hypothetical protein
MSRSKQNQRSKIFREVMPIAQDVIVDGSHYGSWVNVYFRNSGQVSVLFKRSAVKLVTVDADNPAGRELVNIITMHSSMGAPKGAYDRSVYKWAFKHKHIRFIPKKLRSTTTMEDDNAET